MPRSITMFPATRWTELQVSPIGIIATQSTISIAPAPGMFGQHAGPTRYGVDLTVAEQANNRRRRSYSPAGRAASG
jgi:hypothetical protein